MSANKPNVLNFVPIWLPVTQNWLYSLVSDLNESVVTRHVACETSENLDCFDVSNLHVHSDCHFLLRIWDKLLRRIKITYGLKFVLRLIKRHRCNILHSHFGHVAWTNINLIEGTGIHHVVTFYGLDVQMIPQSDPIWLVRYKELFESCQTVLCEGVAMKNSLVKLGCPESKIRVHHLGVDIENIKFIPRYHKKSSAIRVLMAASFREKKGIPFAIRALSIVQKSVDIELTIIGDAGSDDKSINQKHKIMDALNSTGMIERTSLLGFMGHSDMIVESYKHDIFLHPSITAKDGDTEGGAPVIILEMLASGMPVVSTYHCDIPEVVGPEYQPYLAAERNDRDLSDKILLLISNSQLWADTAISARARLEIEYNRHIQARKLEKLYVDMVNQ